MCDVWNLIIIISIHKYSYSQKYILNTFEIQLKDKVNLLVMKDFTIHETFLTFESDSSKNQSCLFKYNMRKLEFKISDEKFKQIRKYCTKDKTFFLASGIVSPSTIEVRNPMKNTVKVAKRTKIVSIVTISKAVMVPSFIHGPRIVFKCQCKDFATL